MEPTRIERAALELFGATYLIEAPGLIEHLRDARVVSRENTGSGFFTHLEVDRDAAPPVACTSPLDGLSAHVEGMNGDIEFLLFFKDGYAFLLEAYSIEGEATAAIDFDSARFSPPTLLWPPKRQ